MKIYFLDFEASSLDPDSYPIEIGWVNQDGQGESYLIQPHASWRGWSVASERVHHITQDMLRSARPAEEIARRAHAVLADAVIVSDQPVFEKFWLAKLLETINQPALFCYDVQALVGEEIKRVKSAILAEPDSREWHRQARCYLDAAQMAACSAYEGAAMARPQVHRALADAEDLWRGWRAVVKAIDALIAEVAG